jgi:phage gp36-like protein
MTYCTQADLETRFGALELQQLTDREANEEIDSTVIDKAIADADALIDGYLAGRYTVPLAVVPANLTRLACDIARYLLYENAATEIVIARYEQALRYLEQVAKGQITLVSEPPATTTADAVVMQSDTPVFARGLD